MTPKDPATYQAAGATGLRQLKLPWQGNLKKFCIDVIGLNVRGCFNQNALEVAIDQHALVQILPGDTHGFANEANKVLYGKRIIAFCSGQFTVTAVINTGQHIDACGRRLVEDGPMHVFLGGWRVAKAGTLMPMIVQLRDRYQLQAGYSLKQTAHVLGDTIDAVMFVQGHTFVVWVREKRC